MPKVSLNDMSMTLPMALDSGQLCMSCDVQPDVSACSEMLESSVLSRHFVGKIWSRSVYS